MPRADQTPLHEDEMASEPKATLVDRAYAGAYAAIADTLKWFGIHEFSIRKDLSLDADPLIHPTERIKPSVRADTRTAWEKLAMAGENLSATMHPDTLQNLRALLNATFTKTRQDKGAFRVEKLTGITASKTNHHNNPRWASSPTLADLGKECVKAYQDVQPLNPRERIDYCARWEGFSDKDDLEVFTDTWHNGRMYLSNSGGSHHLAMLCHELQRSGNNMVMPAAITTYDIDPVKAHQLQQRFACYLVKGRENECFGRVIILPNHMQFNCNHEYNLGIADVNLNCISPGSPCLPLEGMHAVFVDKTARYAHLSIQMMDQACTQGRACDLFEAIRQTSSLSPAHPDRQPESSPDATETAPTE